MRPALQNTEQSPRQGQSRSSSLLSLIYPSHAVSFLPLASPTVQHVFFTMRLIEALMPRGVEKLALLINFADRGKSPSMTTSKQVLNM